MTTTTTTRKTSAANLLIDSSLRNKETTYVYGEIISIKPWSLVFTPGSSIVKVQTPNNFNAGDQISLSGLVSKHSRLQNAISIKKNSLYARVNHVNHGLSNQLVETLVDFVPIDYVGPLASVYQKNYPIADNVQFYTLKNPISQQTVTVTIGTNNTNRFLEGKHNLYLLYRYINGTYVLDPDAYAIDLIGIANKNTTVNEIGKQNYNHNYVEANTIDLTFGDIYGIPLEAFDRILNIIDANPNSFNIDVGIPASDSNFYTDPTLNANLQEIGKYKLGGSSEMYVQKVIGSQIGYPLVSDFVINLVNNLDSVTGLNLTFSAIPNVQQNVTLSNNRLYWRIGSESTTYSLELDQGQYSPQSLERAIKLASNKVIRNDTIQKQDQNQRQNPFFMLDVSINVQTNIVKFSSWQEYLLTDAISIPFGRVEFEPVPQIDIGTFLFIQPVGMNKSFLYEVVDERIADLNLNQRIIFNTNIEALQNINNDIDLSDSIFDPITSTITSTIANAQNLLIGDLIASNLMLNESAVRVFEVDAISEFGAHVRLSNRKILYGCIAINFPLDLLQGLGPAVGLPVYQPYVMIEFANNFQIGDKIEIFNARPILYTPSTVLNTKHTIYAVSDSDFWIKLEPYNLLPNAIPQTTANAVIGIRFKELLQLLFGVNFPSSMGQLFGFRNTLTEDVITPYAFTVTNIEKKIIEPVLNFGGESFFYVRSSAIGKPLHGTEFQDVVAVIYWNDNSNLSSKITYNSFAPTFLEYDPPLNLQQIDIYCTDSIGSLINFRDQDFSLNFVVSLS
jgi:hypothetical protein